MMKKLTPKKPVREIATVKASIVAGTSKEEVSKMTKIEAIKATIQVRFYFV